MHLIHKLHVKLIKNFSLIKIKYLFIIFLLSPFLIFVVLIKPIVLIRFGNLGCERIGRFSNAEDYLLSSKFKKVTYTHIYREKNTEADKMVNEALDNRK